MSENKHGCTVTRERGAVVAVEQRVWTTDVWRAMTSAVNRKSDTVMHQVLMQVCESSVWCARAVYSVREPCRVCESSV
jgi:hypothetical protein